MKFKLYTKFRSTGGINSTKSIKVILKPYKVKRLYCISGNLQGKLTVSCACDLCVIKLSIHMMSPSEQFVLKQDVHHISIVEMKKIYDC